MPLADFNKTIEGAYINLITNGRRDLTGYLGQYDGGADPATLNQTIQTKFQASEASVLASLTTAAATTKEKMKAAGADATKLARVDRGLAGAKKAIEEAMEGLGKEFEKTAGLDD